MSSMDFLTVAKIDQRPPGQPSPSAPIVQFAICQIAIIAQCKAHPRQKNTITLISKPFSPEPSLARGLLH